MRLLILGATGVFGQVLVTRALRRGFDVTAFARRPERLTVEGAGLTTVKGDVLERATLDPHVRGHDAVLFCVGDPKSKDTRTIGMRNTVAAMTAAGVQRIVALSGLGAGTSRKNRGFFFDKVTGPLLHGKTLEDQNGLEAEVRKSRLDWVVVRPGAMKSDVPAAGKGRWVVSLDGAGITDTVSPDDVADFMLDQLKQDEYVRKTPSIGSPIVG